MLGALYLGCWLDNLGGFHSATQLVSSGWSLRLFCLGVHQIQLHSCLVGLD